MLAISTRAVRGSVAQPQDQYPDKCGYTASPYPLRETTPLSQNEVIDAREVSFWYLLQLGRSGLFRLDARKEARTRRCLQP